MLDRTEQRIVGVLIEKEATVPDIYPLSENALLDGCNQKSNRDPVLDLVQFQVAGALMALCEKGWITRVDGSGRVTKYRHKVVERLGLTKAELAVFCELLVRGPQAPGALKPRVARMGFLGEATDVERVLQQLASRPQPLVAQLPVAPRERDHKWRHLVGDGSEPGGVDRLGGAAAAPRPVLAVAAERPRLVPGPGALSPLTAEGAGRSLEQRVAALEQDLAQLRAAIARLQQNSG